MTLPYATMSRSFFSPKNSLLDCFSAESIALAWGRGTKPPPHDETYLSNNETGPSLGCGESVMRETTAENRGGGWDRAGGLRGDGRRRRGDGGSGGGVVDRAPPASKTSTSSDRVVRANVRFLVVSEPTGDRSGGGGGYGGGGYGMSSRPVPGGGGSESDPLPFASLDALEGAMAGVWDKAAAAEKMLSDAGGFRYLGCEISGVDRVECGSCGGGDCGDGTETAMQSSSLSSSPPEDEVGAMATRTATETETSAATCHVVVVTLTLEMPMTREHGGVSHDAVSAEDTLGWLRDAWYGAAFNKTGSGEYVIESLASRLDALSASEEFIISPLPRTRQSAGRNVESVGRALNHEEAAKAADKSGGNSNTAAIVGGIMGGLTLLFLCCCCCAGGVFYRKHVKAEQKAKAEEISKQLERNKRRTHRQRGGRTRHRHDGDDDENDDRSKRSRRSTGDKSRHTSRRSKEERSRQSKDEKSRSRRRSRSKEDKSRRSKRSSATSPDESRRSGTRKSRGGPSLSSKNKKGYNNGSIASTAKMTQDSSAGSSAFNGMLNGMPFPQPPPYHQGQTSFVDNRDFHSLGPGTAPPPQAMPYGVLAYAGNDQTSFAAQPGQSSLQNFGRGGDAISLPAHQNLMPMGPNQIVDNGSGRMVLALPPPTGWPASAPQRLSPPPANFNEDDWDKSASRDMRRPPARSLAGGDNYDDYNDPIRPRSRRRRVPPSRRRPYRGERHRSSGRRRRDPSRNYDDDDDDMSKVSRSRPRDGEEDDMSRASSRYRPRDDDDNMSRASRHRPRDGDRRRPYRGAGRSRGRADGYGEEDGRFISRERLSDRIDEGEEYGEDEGGRPLPPFITSVEINPYEGVGDDISLGESTMLSLGTSRTEMSSQSKKMVEQANTMMKEAKKLMTQSQNLLPLSNNIEEEDEDDEDMDTEMNNIKRFEKEEGEDLAMKQQMQEMLNRDTGRPNSLSRRDMLRRDSSHRSSLSRQDMDMLIKEKSQKSLSSRPLRDTLRRENSQRTSVSRRSGEGSHRSSRMDMARKENSQRRRGRSGLSKEKSQKSLSSRRDRDRDKDRDISREETGERKYPKARSQKMSSQKALMEKRLREREERARHKEYARARNKSNENLRVYADETEQATVSGFDRVESQNELPDLT